jgi:N-acetylglutamate synthase-like GNAT family acetyltransferase
MMSRPIRHRRARRSDFDAIHAIMEASGLLVPAPERSALRRFRRVVADLGADLYVAEVDSRVIGVVHLTYTRGLTGSPRGHLELLAVAPEARRQGVGRGLVALAAARARRRGGAALRCGAAATDGARAFLFCTGWRGRGEDLEFDLADTAQ